jgi:hypothetical protein
MGRVWVKWVNQGVNRVSYFFKWIDWLTNLWIEAVIVAGDG